MGYKSAPTSYPQNALGSFDQFYEQSLRHAVDGFEKERMHAAKKVNRYFWISTALTVFVAVVTLFFFWEYILDFLSRDEDNIKLLGVLLVPPVLATAWARQKYWKPLKRQIREMVPGYIFAFVDPKAEYKPFENIDKEMVSASGLFKKFSKYKGEDYARFMFDDRQCEFSEVTLTWGKGKYSLSSKGVFIVAETDQEIENPVWVWSRGERDYVRRDFKGEIVDLESPTFEKLFDVRGDQFEARRIFTPLFMYRAIDLRVNKNEAVYLSYAGKRVYIYLNKKKEVIDVSLFKKFNKEAVRGIYDEINDVLSILTTLNIRKEPINQYDYSALESFDQELVDIAVKRADQGERSFIFVFIMKLVFLAALIVAVFLAVYFLFAWFG